MESGLHYPLGVGLFAHDEDSLPRPVDAIEERQQLAGTACRYRLVTRYAAARQYNGDDIGCVGE